MKASVALSKLLPQRRLHASVRHFGNLNRTCPFQETTGEEKGPIQMLWLEHMMPLSCLFLDLHCHVSTENPCELPDQMCCSFDTWQSTIRFSRIVQSPLRDPLRTKELGIGVVCH